MNVADVITMSFSPCSSTRCARSVRAHSTYFDPQVDKVATFKVRVECLDNPRGLVRLHAWFVGEENANDFGYVDVRDHGTEVYLKVPNLPNNCRPIALIVQMFQTVSTELDQSVFNPAGTTAFLLESRSSTAKFKVYETSTAQETGTLFIETVEGVTLKDQDNKLMLLETDAGFRPAYSKFESDITQWAMSKGRDAVCSNAIDQRIRNIWLPYLNCEKFMSSAEPFIRRRVQGEESESFLLQILQIAACRRGVDVEHDDLSDAKMIELAAESLQLVPNAYIYARDFFRTPSNQEINIERSSCSCRHTQVGDCEDFAKEILLLYVALCSGDWKNAALRRARTLLRDYIPTFTIGAVTNASLQNAGLYNGKFESHAFVMFIPRISLQNALDATNTGDDRLFVKWTNASQSSLSVLVLDGTGLKRVSSGGQSHPQKKDALKRCFRAAKTLRKGHIIRRLKHTRENEDNFYKYITTSLVGDSSVTDKHGTSVAQIWWHNREKNLMGVGFDSVRKHSERSGDTLCASPTFIIPQRQIINGRNYTNNDIMRAIENVNRANHPVIPHVPVLVDGTVSPETSKVVRVIEKRGIRIKKVLRTTQPMPDDGKDDGGNLSFYLLFSDIDSSADGIAAILWESGVRDVYIRDERIDAVAGCVQITPVNF